MSEKIESGSPVESRAEMKERAKELFQKINNSLEISKQDLEELHKVMSDLV